MMGHTAREEFRKMERWDQTHRGSNRIPVGVLSHSPPKRDVSQSVLLFDVMESFPSFCFIPHPSSFPPFFYYIHSPVLVELGGGYKK